MAVTVPRDSTVLRQESVGLSSEESATLVDSGFEDDSTYPTRVSRDDVVSAEPEIEVGRPYRDTYNRASIQPWSPDDVQIDVHHGSTPTGPPRVPSG